MHVYTRLTPVMALTVRRTLSVLGLLTIRLLIVSVSLGSE
jgi:hypothetical protein